MRKSIAIQFNEAWNERRFNYGMTKEEINNLLKKLHAKRNTFWGKFIGNTCVIDEPTGEILHYACDIEFILAQIFKYRAVSPQEWD